MKTFFILIEALTAIVFVGMSIPLVLGKVPPNGWYGVRLKKTLENEEIWYKANAYFGRDFLIASLFVLSVCIALFFNKESMDLNTLLIVISTVMLIPYVVAVVKTFVYLRKLSKK
jgi:uncharacterized membrane protein